MVSPENVSFAAMLAEHRQQTEVPAEVLERSLGAARFAMRLRGGYLTDCELINPRTDKPNTLFKTDEDLAAPEPHASRTTCYVDGYDTDDEEGFPRWVDYRPVANGKMDAPIVALQADVGDGPFGLRKIVRLHDGGSRLSSHIVLSNRTDGPKTVALGEHFCFDFPRNDLRGLAIGRVWLGHGKYGKEVQNRLQSGNPHFFAGYHGQVLVDFPDKRRIALRTSVAVGRHDRESRLPLPPQRIGMVVRHEADSGRLCLEPTLRKYDDEHKVLAGGGVLKPGFVVALTTSIDLLK